MKLQVVLIHELISLFINLTIDLFVNLGCPLLKSLSIFFVVPVPNLSGFENIRVLWRVLCAFVAKVNMIRIFVRSHETIPDAGDQSVVLHSSFIMVNRVMRSIQKQFERKKRHMIVNRHRPN